MAGRGFTEKRKDDDEAGVSRLRIDIRLANRLDDFVKKNDKGITKRNDAATYLLAFALDEMDARVRRKEVFEAWIAGGRKGLPPPPP